MSSARHSLVFLTYNHPELIDARLDEADCHLSHRSDVEVIVFDNGSEDYGVRLALTARSQLAHIPISIYRAKKNLGFGPGFNRAIQHITADPERIVHLLSSDVMILGDFIEVLGEFKAREVICHEKIVHKAGWNVFGDTLIAYPSGYYFALYKTAWDILGGFDKRFAPHDYEDVDLGYRISKSDDFSLILRDDLPLRHISAATIGYTDERFEHTVKMRAVFAEKWGLSNEPERP